VLALFVIASGAFLIHYTITGPTGDLIGGWSLEPTQFKIGLTRLMFPFFAGLLLSRVVKIRLISHAFLWCSLLLIAVLCFPRLGDDASLWKNGIYESIVVILIFPMIVYLGASGQVKGHTEKLCKFLGDISYPIYITHYPIIYIYTAWVFDNKKHLSSAWPYSLLVLFSSVLLAWICLKFYDEPIRKWLQKKWQ
jgi:peptidoglycan/LPS O-acetylase OafA/YrhL